MHDFIQIRGAREHNLKNIDLDLPKNSLIVITGLSGSGKSSLAFDTIYAEGQRRYIESLSAYARQFLGQSNKPDVDSIEGLSPAISIDQKSASHNPRSTVGTVTEIHDYLRLLYAKIGLAHCQNDGASITRASIDEVIDRVIEQIPEETELALYAPIVRERKGEYHELLNNLAKEGFSEVIIDGKTLELNQTLPVLNRYSRHTLEVLIDRFILNDREMNRFSEGIEQAAGRAEGSVIIRSNKNEIRMNLSLLCTVCGTSFPKLEPRSFSFNSPFGACNNCDGLGVQRKIDPSLVLPDETKNIAEGAILPWTYSSKNWYGFTLRAVTEYYGIDMNAPIKTLKESERELLLTGPEAPVRIPATYYTQGKRNVFHLRFEGIIPLLERRWRETESESVRQDLVKYMTESLCPTCTGARLKKVSLLVTVGGKNIAEISALPVDEAWAFFQTLTLSKRDTLIANRILKEIVNRLRFLANVGLGYLTLNRSAVTLAGGEAQRIRLASQVGSHLTGVLYVLDEPSIGLHARDNRKLIAILKKLRDLGNTVIVVEHDEETIQTADYVVDIGPHAGKRGGQVIAQGAPNDVMQNPRSLTGQYLAGAKQVLIPNKRRTSKYWLSIFGATENNLKRVNAHLPLGTFTCITGVSGSGKSTLLTDVIYNALARKLNRALVKPGAYERLEGFENLKRAILISQAPIGRTPRSNPATYTGVFTHIRELFAATSGARTRGYTAGRFSFNIAGGRCENCAGDGAIKIEMQFLPDVYVPCDVCLGKRYNRDTLNIQFAGKNIAEILELTVDEALDFFADFPAIADKLKVLVNVGLGYIELGQSATTLSGGEAQRIKLASELARRGHGDTFYVLDEPTTGLHTDDIVKLLEVLNQLVDQGNTVVVIEHNLDVIKCADWVIDLGPEGGEAGGRVIACGAPEKIAVAQNSYTGQFLKRILHKKIKATASVRETSFKHDVASFPHSSRAMISAENT
ncbi:excinuclease ABC subunit UvrA [Candidatus Berkelbacteria bacterium]|nr:excinuclease ABC subunit UvrA [Candidatus Berkelbacteria bacterium]